MLAAIEVIASVATDQLPQGIGVRFDAVDDGGPQRGQGQPGAAETRRQRTEGEQSPLTEEHPFPPTSYDRP